MLGGAPVQPPHSFQRASTLICRIAVGEAVIGDYKQLELGFLVGLGEGLCPS